MKLFPQRTLAIAAIAAAFVGLSATAIASNPGAMNSELHAQHLAQRTHMAPEVIQLAQTAQATQNAETAATGSAKPRHERHANRMERSERMERMQARMAERQARLKAELNLSAEQEPAWNAFVTRMDAAKGSGQRGQSERSNWSELTTPERLDKMQTRMAEREAIMNQRFDAIKSFYANLNTDQQKVFDSQNMGSFHRTGMKGDHHKGGHKHHQHGGKGHRGMGVQAPTTPQS
jgi:hypothetical protein